MTLPASQLDLPPPLEQPEAPPTDLQAHFAILLPPLVFPPALINLPPQVVPPLLPTPVDLLIMQYREHKRQEILRRLASVEELLVGWSWEELDVLQRVKVSLGLESVQGAITALQ